MWYWQARNQLGTPRGAKSFLRAAQIFKTMSNNFNYVLHIFPGGEKKFAGGFSPLAPSDYGPGYWALGLVVVLSNFVHFLTPLYRKK